MKVEDYRKRFVALPISECARLARFVQLTQEGLSVQDAFNEVGGLQAESYQLLKDMLADKELWQPDGTGTPNN